MPTGPRRKPDAQPAAAHLPEQDLKPMQVLIGVGVGARTLWLSTKATAPVVT